MHSHYENLYKNAKNLEDKSSFKLLMKTFEKVCPETPEQQKIFAMHNDWKTEQDKLDSDLKIFHKKRKALKNKEEKIDKIADKIKDVSIAINRELCDTKYEIKGSFYLDLPINADKEQNIHEYI